MADAHRRGKAATTPSELDDAIAEWSEAIRQLHENSTEEPGDRRTAEHALGMAWSAWGYQPSRMDAWRMLVTATEVGYLIALRDLRAGDLDEEIRTARPDLAGDA